MRTPLCASDLCASDTPGDIPGRALSLEASVLPCPALDQSHRYGPTSDPVRLYLARLSPRAAPRSPSQKVLRAPAVESDPDDIHTTRYSGVKSSRSGQARAASRAGSIRWM